MFLGFGLNLLINLIMIFGKTLKNIKIRNKIVIVPGFISNSDAWPQLNRLHLIIFRYCVIQLFPLFNHLYRFFSSKRKFLKCENFSLKNAFLVVGYI